MHGAANKGGTTAAYAPVLYGPGAFLFVKVQDPLRLPRPRGRDKTSLRIGSIPLLAGGAEGGL